MSDQVTWNLPLSVQARYAEGRHHRAQFPRRMLAELPRRHRDPIALLSEQNATRLPSLVPLRNERMGASPFTFYRGTAVLMADDLAHSPSTGLSVAACGDAHVSNFGFYASPSRQLIFDLNDFDEAAWAPWEWDLKRLVASVVIAGQTSARDDLVIEQAARSAVLTYARGIDTGVQLSPVQRYYTRFDIDRARASMPRHAREVLTDAIKHATKRTGDRAVRRVTELGADGRLRFIESPPTMSRVPAAVLGNVEAYIAQYVASANVDIALVMRSYELSDVIRRVVGVGSVGTRCFLTVFQDGSDHALLLQAKEAGRSVLAGAGRSEQPPELTRLIEESGEGARVVALQRILQAQSDPFLGSLRADDGVELYVRQFHDMKGGIDTEELEDRAFTTYAQACAAVLARAHAQSPRAIMVAGYLGRGRAAADAITEWSYAYADVAHEDYQSFRSWAASTTT